MPKSFFLEPGLFARCDGLWYEPGILMVVEPGDHVEIFAARDGTPGRCTAHYVYRQLNDRQPPAGLRGDWRGRRRLSQQRPRAGWSSHFAPRARDEWANAPAFA